MEIKIRGDSLYNVYFMVFDPPAIQNQPICISAEESSHVMSLVPGNQQFTRRGHPTTVACPLARFYPHEAVMKDISLWTNSQ